MKMIACDSKEFYLQWADIHLEQAKKFSRLKYPLDEANMYYHLLQRQIALDNASNATL